MLLLVASEGAAGPRLPAWHVDGSAPLAKQPLALQSLLKLAGFGGYADVASAQDFVDGGYSLHAVAKGGRPRRTPIDLSSVLSQLGYKGKEVVFVRRESPAGSEPGHTADIGAEAADETWQSELPAKASVSSAPAAPSQDPPAAQGAPAASIPRGLSPKEGHPHSNSDLYASTPQGLSPAGLTHSNVDFYAPIPSRPAPVDYRHVTLDSLILKRCQYLSLVETLSKDACCPLCRCREGVVEQLEAVEAQNALLSTRLAKAQSDRHTEEAALQARLEDLKTQLSLILKRCQYLSLVETLSKDACCPLCRCREGVVEQLEAVEAQNALLSTRLAKAQSDRHTEEAALQARLEDLKTQLRYLGLARDAFALDLGT
ncbi:hypothetical protein DIPPA_22552 [Diplonema papillatum]|nr:hypothetical protein DIPPA_22552 [Diplonema papillatum]